MENKRGTQKYKVLDKPIAPKKGAPLVEGALLKKRNIAFREIYGNIRRPQVPPKAEHTAKETKTASEFEKTPQHSWKEAKPKSRIKQSIKENIMNMSDKSFMEMLAKRLTDYRENKGNRENLKNAKRNDEQPNAKWQEGSVKEKTAARFTEQMSHHRQAKTEKAQEAQEAKVTPSPATPTMGGSK